ncbi:uncharacterized protein [Penaeus vannamei]|uniref:uncharacterized protein n=1 Tax=Penaeus vannamei TaxID=6689 RepID=UPI00387F8DE2
MILSANRNKPMTFTLLVVLWAVAGVVVTVSGVRGQLSPLVAHPTWGPRPGQPPGATVGLAPTPHFPSAILHSSTPTPMSHSDPENRQQRPKVEWNQEWAGGRVASGVSDTNEVREGVTAARHASLQGHLRHSTQRRHKDRGRDSEEGRKGDKPLPGLSGVLSAPLPTTSPVSRLGERVTRAHVPRRRKQVVAPSLLKLTPPLRFLLHNEPSTPLPPFSARFTKNRSRRKLDSDKPGSSVAVGSGHLASSAQRSVDEGRGGIPQEAKDVGQGSSAPQTPSVSPLYITASRHRGLKSVWRDDLQNPLVARHANDRRGKSNGSGSSETHGPSSPFGRKKHGCRKRLTQFFDRFERVSESLLPSPTRTIPDEGSLFDESTESDPHLLPASGTGYERHFERLRRQIRGTQCFASSANAKTQRRKESRRSKNMSTGKDGNTPNVTSRPPQASSGGLFIQLKDEDGRRAEADLYPGRRYSGPKSQQLSNITVFKQNRV